MSEKNPSDITLAEAIVQSQKIVWNDSLGNLTPLSRADAEKDISEYNATSSEKWRLPTKIEFQNSIKNQALPAFQSDITYWTQDGEWGTETAWLAEDDKGLNRNKEDAKRAVRLVRDVA